MPSRPRRLRTFRRRLMPLVTVAAVVGVLLVTTGVVSPVSAWGPTSAPSPTPPPPKLVSSEGIELTTPPVVPKVPKPKHAPPARYTCPGFSGIERTNPVSQLYQDSFAWSTFPAYQIGDGSGDINWRANPYNNPSWYMWVHSLRWLGQGVIAARAGDRKAMARVTAIVHDWVKDNPYDWKVDVGAHESTMHRTNVLICTRQAVLAGLKVTKLPKTYAWLDQALLDHAKFLENNWSGAWNHGTDESIALFGIGCTLGRADFKEAAEDRFAAAINESIDAEGSTNEQATAYAQFNYSLWGRAIKVMKECGAKPSTAIASRRALLANWLTMATDSFGNLHQIGDSEVVKTNAEPGTPLEYAATLGAKGPRPTQRIGIFDAGYVFGRTGWGEKRAFRDESTYSIRYGRPRALHGHDDHMSITYNSHGRQILVDSGHAGYQSDKWHNYVRSEFAHNVLASPLMAGRLTETKLDRRELLPTSEFYEFSDEPGPGMTRRRAVLVLKDPDLIVTLDRATSAQDQPFQTQWHLPADQQVSVTSPTTVVAQKPGDKVKTVVLQMPYQDELPADSLMVAQGQAEPVQGWQYPKITIKNPAPTVLFKRQGRSATILSLIIPAASKAKVTQKTRWQGSTYLIDLTVGTLHTTIGVLPDGTLSRVK